MKALLDSDALFALFVASDRHHLQAKKHYQELSQQKATLYVSNLVIQETATVLSVKVGQAIAKDFFYKLPALELKLIEVNYLLEQKSWFIFLEQNKKATSFIDCSNIAITEDYKLDGIFSFDKFYKRCSMQLTS